MGKAGYLPDISGVFQRWRQHYLEGLAIGNWGMVSLGLNNMNGSLDIDYRLPISQEEWDSQEDGFIVWDCPNCTEEREFVVNKGEENEKKITREVPTRSKRADIIIFDEFCTDIIAFLTKKRFRKMWICPKCKGAAPVQGVHSTLMKYPEPHYRACIYPEPQRPLTGLKMRRGVYPKMMKEWARSFSKELEHQLALYRLEYVKQNGEDMAFEVGDFKEENS